MCNPKCAVCGHINRADARLCDVCESSLGVEDGTGAGRTFHSSYDGYAGEPREGGCRLTFLRRISSRRGALSVRI